MMKPLSTRARVTLDRYKALDSLASADKKRLLDVIQQRGARGHLPRFEVQTTSRVAPLPSWPVRLWAAPLARLSVAVAITGVPALAAVGIRNRSIPSSLFQTSSVVARTQDADGPSSPFGAPDVATRNDTPAPALQGTAPAAANSRARARSERSTDRAAPATSSTEPTIDAEMRLLNAAQASLRSGDFAEALRLLDEHASRFPSSKLADARDVAQMTTLCKLGQSTQARLEADRFLAVHPNSPFAERVKKVCFSQARP